MNCETNLQSKPFSLLSLEEKLEIKNLGRHMPTYGCVDVKLKMHYFVSLAFCLLEKIFGHDLELKT